MSDENPVRPTLAARLSDALKALCFEASAVLNIEEAAIRGLVGHTNVNALRQRIAEGRALLLEVAALTPEPLGQEWVSKVTQDDGPELSVIGAPEPPPPSVPAMPPMPKC